MVVNSQKEISFIVFFKREWDFFISDIADSFAVVTETVKDQLIKQMGVEPSKIEVVYHSYDESIFMDNRNGCRNEQLNVIFAGRLVKNKGIDEFLEIVKIIQTSIFIS
ncbi:glycosyltransferase family protein [Klebsiella quasipneumoniae]|uniref:hypothetical protein n=1 Tax=Klebsiella quasipneumoniae TaxID=1463165 RepID=UPI000F54525C|nr:hypothetical protein [Klebsiella quasipneumoniae]